MGGGRNLIVSLILENFFLLFPSQMLQAAFERNFRKKDELIEDLEGVMRQNDEEYDNAFDMHVHNIDQLLGSFSVHFFYIEL